LGPKTSIVPPEENGRIDEPSRTASNPAAFAPADPTDNRKPLDWQSKYPPDAWRYIKLEGAYLFLLLAAVPTVLLVLWLDAPKYWFGLSDAKYTPILKYCLAWMGGLLGGTLFSLKWLYHSVAKQIWHLDRRPWRAFTPHISGGLAFAVTALVSSGIFRVFDREATTSKSLVLGVAFLVGYFSDSAIAKLNEIANTLFGASRAREKHIETKKSGSTTDKAEYQSGGQS
jgi:hypothetical protein